MKFITAILLIIFCINLEAQIYKTNHFKIFYTKVDEKNIEEIADSVENNYTRIVTNLQSQELPIVSVYLYADSASFREGVKNWVRNPPVFMQGITLGDSAIHMVSPDAPNSDGYQTTIRYIIHEFAHCVSRHINMTIGNKPRWLWESIAIYEAKQTSDPHQLSYLVNQKPPMLSELNVMAKPYVYEVGYL